jgi:hypothetical protein
VNRRKPTKKTAEVNKIRKNIIIPIENYNKRLDSNNFNHFMGGCLFKKSSLYNVSKILRIET